MFNSIKYKRDNKMKKVCVYRTETCSRRKLDAEKFSNYFLKNGYKLIGNPKKADIIVLVTCAYVEDLAELSLNKVNTFKKYN